MSLPILNRRGKTIPTGRYNETYGYGGGFILCPNCRRQLPPGALWCDFCNARICPNCHSLLDRHASFCTNCGWQDYYFQQSEIQACKPRRFPAGLGIALIFIAFALVAFVIVSISPLTTLPSVSKPSTLSDNDITAPPVTNTIVESTPPTSPQSATVKQLIQYALDHINKDRSASGLAAVTLGGNSASQKHAEDMLNNGYFSHWGMDGMKPYMRYTLAGGLNYEAENAFMTATRWRGGTDTSYKRNPKEMLDEAEISLMESPGHKANILNKWHKTVNIGMAYSNDSLFLVQQFEGGYISFSSLPVLNNDVLSVSGQTLNGFTIKQIQLWYDQLPHELTPGQLGATHSYDAGTPAAFIRPSAPAGNYYAESEAPYSWESGVDPYSISPDTPAPDRPNSTETSISHGGTVQWVDARQWKITGSSFAIEANLSRILSKFGKGVYTVRIWGSLGTESICLTSYTIFYR
jgi:uncharacterized protein YkwD